MRLATNLLTPTKAEPIDILLVDDSPENLLALEVVLKSPDYNLVKANSGKEALRYLLDHDPAIIILDVQMPEMDGFETASLIKQSERYKNIPIIFVTALSKDERFVHHGYRTGAVDYIFKPFDDTILRSKVSVFAELYRKSQEIRRQAELLRESERKERAQEISRLELKSLKRNQVAQQKYRDLVDGITNGIIWSIDADTRQCTFVSQSAEALLGYPIENWKSDPNFWSKHLHPQDRERVLKTLTEFTPTTEELRFEHRFVNLAGEPLWFQTGIRVAEKSEGPGYELRGLSIDITKIKEAELVLKENAKRTKVLAETARVVSRSLIFEEMLKELGNLALQEFADSYGIYLLDNETRDIKPIVARGNFTRKLACGLEDLESPLARVIREGKATVFEENSILVPLSTRGKVFGAATFHVTGDKRRYDTQDFATAQELANQIAAAIDNSLLYQSAQEAIHTREEFLSIASHELKTPLTPLKLQMHMMLRMMDKLGLDSADSARLRKMVTSSDGHVDRISRLIEELLDVSRISSGKFTLNMEDFELSELVEETLERFSNHLQAAGCTITIHKDGPVVGCWDRFRIEQVFVNLLTNAMKYGAGKPIEIKLWTDAQGDAHLSVQDHGLGIEKIDQDRIFQRFERAVSPKHFGGLGLGLYIVSQILEAHSGKIVVDSKLGAGSVFTVTLPRQKAAEK